jgi:hypothetical protein
MPQEKEKTQTPVWYDVTPSPKTDYQKMLEEGRINPLVERQEELVPEPTPSLVKPPPVEPPPLDWVRNNPLWGQIYQHKAQAALTAIQREYDLKVRQPLAESQQLLAKAQEEYTTKKAAMEGSLRYWPEISTWPLSEPPLLSSRPRLAREFTEANEALNAATQAHVALTGSLKPMIQRYEANVPLLEQELLKPPSEWSPQAFDFLSKADPTIKNLQRRAEMYEGEVFSQYFGQSPVQEQMREIGGESYATDAVVSALGSIGVFGAGEEELRQQFISQDVTRLMNQAKTNKRPVVDQQDVHALVREYAAQFGFTPEEADNPLSLPDPFRSAITTTEAEMVRLLESEAGESAVTPLNVLLVLLGGLVGQAQQVADVIMAPIESQRQRFAQMRQELAELRANQARAATQMAATKEERREQRKQMFLRMALDMRETNARLEEARAARTQEAAIAGLRLAAEKAAEHNRLASAAARQGYMTAKEAANMARDTNRLIQKTLVDIAQIGSEADKKALKDFLEGLKRQVPGGGE